MLKAFLESKVRHTGHHIDHWSRLRSDHRLAGFLAGSTLSTVRRLHRIGLDQSSDLPKVLMTDHLGIFLGHRRAL